MYVLSTGMRVPHPLIYYITMRACTHATGLSRAFMCGWACGDLAAGEAKPRYMVDRWRPDFNTRAWTANLYAGHAVSDQGGRAMSGGGGGGAGDAVANEDG